MSWLALYHFDDIGAAIVADLSGNGHDITLTGTAGAQVTGGQTGGALGKTGATMPVLPAGLLAAAQSDDRTIMFDAKQNLSTWWMRFADDGIGSGTWGVLNISGSMAVQARRASDSSLATRPTAAQPTATEWHNYAATYKRSTGVISIYRDGALAATSSFAAGTQLSVAADRIDLAEWTSTGAAIDNLRIADHCADAAEVASLAGTPVTPPAKTGAVTLTATAATTVSGQKNATGMTALSATGATSASGSKAAASGKVLGAVAAIVAAGARAAPGVSRLAATAALALAGSSHRAGSVTLRATATILTEQAGVLPPDITLTATLAPQPGPGVALADRRWTATLEAQP